MRGGDAAGRSAPSVSCRSGRVATIPKAQGRDRSVGRWPQSNGMQAVVIGGCSETRFARGCPPRLDTGAPCPAERCKPPNTQSAAVPTRAHSLLALGHGVWSLLAQLTRAAGRKRGRGRRGRRPWQAAALARHLSSLLSPDEWRRPCALLALLQAWDWCVDPRGIDCSALAARRRRCSSGGGRRQGCSGGSAFGHCLSKAVSQARAFPPYLYISGYVGASRVVIRPSLFGKDAQRAVT